jgi:succinylglutamate desuccinylase
MMAECSILWKKTKLSYSIIHEYDSGIVGPRVTIMGGVHGNEQFGIGVLRSLASVKPVRGKLVLIEANIAAIESNVRYIDTNLNRLFTDETVSDSVEGKTALELKPYLKNTDVLLDLHASNTQDSIPFVILHSEQSHLAKLCLIQTLLYDIHLFEPGGSEEYVRLNGGEAVCLECGFRDNPDAKNIAIQTIFNFLHHYGLLVGEVKIPVDQLSYVVTAGYFSKSDSFIPDKAVGDFSPISKGELIGKDGGVSVFAESDCYLLFVREQKSAGMECFLSVQLVDS